MLVNFAGAEAASRPRSRSEPRARRHATAVTLRRSDHAGTVVPACWYALLVACACAFAATAHAQTMYKCQNANGKIEYSDRPCWSGSEIKRMTPTGGPTREEIERARMRAAADQQRAVEQERQAAQARKAAQTQALATGGDAAAGATAVRDPGNEKALTHSRTGWDTPTRSGQVQAGADRAYRDEKARLSASVAPKQAPVVPSPASPGPAVVTTCDAGGCWDASGRRYTSSGSSLVRNDGRVCQQVGSTLTCN